VLGQALGRRSRQTLPELCLHESAKDGLVARHRYGRSVGRVQCAGKDASSHQVGAGMAWVYDHYSKPSSPLYPPQAEARGAPRGLWADNDPVPPWQWRREKRPER
jgi:endonuclease YncB( thermonuclease family)